MRFSNKNVLITGGSTGIGFASAQGFLNEGANVIITGKSAENLQKAEAALNSPKLKTIVSDTAEVASIEALAKAVADSGNKLDVLFMNAGIAKFAPIEHTTENDFDAQFNVNVKGLFFTLQKLIPQLANGASVLLTSSVVSTGAMANGSAYSATNAAVSAIGRAAAAESAEKNIRVNVVSPGPIETPIFDKGGFSPEEKEGFKQQVSAGTLVKRMGTSEEVANTVLFLASEAASNITGVELLVDGGIGLRR